MRLRHVARGHLQRIKRGAAAVISPQQAKWLRVRGAVPLQILHFIDGDPLRPGRQCHGQHLRHKRRLLPRRNPKSVIGHGPCAVVVRRRVRLHQPDGFFDAALAHQQPKFAQNVVNHVGLEVEMGGGHIEVVVVCLCLGVGQKLVKEQAHVLRPSIFRIPKIGKRGQMHRGVGVRRPRHHVSRLLQLGKIGHSAIPCVAGGVLVPNIGFVPDYPLVNAPLITADRLAHKARPQVLRVVGRQVQPQRQAILVPRPLGQADEQADDVPPLRQFPLDTAVAHLGVPLLRAVRLHLRPLEADARPCRAHFGSIHRRFVALHHPKPPIGRGRRGCGGGGWRFLGGHGRWPPQAHKQ